MQPQPIEGAQRIDPCFRRDDAVERPSNTTCLTFVAAMKPRIALYYQPRSAWTKEGPANVEIVDYR